MSELVGRERELAAVDAALGQLAEGRSGLLGVCGDPGIGKSRLLAELGARAESAGHLLLTGAATEFERDLPFSPFVDALDAYLGSLERSRLGKRGIETGGELGAVFSSLAGEEPAAPEVGAELHRTHRAISSLLSALGDTRGLVLILEDLHWADASSIDLLLALCRRPPRGQVGLALSFRPQQATAALADALRIAEPEGTSTVLTLQPLATDDARRILPPELGGAAGERVLGIAAGNPFYLKQLGRTPASELVEGLGDELIDGGFRIPAVVAASLADELRRLEPETRLLLEGAAVAGEPFELRLAAVIAGLDFDRALELVDEATTLGLVGPAQTPAHFVFRHPLLRRAAYEGSGDGWRLAAHARAAAELERRDADPALRAHHVAISGEHGDRAAIELLQTAAAAAVWRAPASAVRWLQAALELLGETPSAERAQLLSDLGRAQLAAGDLEGARASTLGAIAASEKPPPQMLIDLAEIDRWTGNVPDAIELLEELAAEPEIDAALRARLELGLLYLCRWAAQPAEAFAHGGRALEAAAESADAAMLAAAQAALAEATASFAPATAAPVYDEAVRLMRAVPDTELGPVLDAVYSLGWAATHLERYDDSLEHFGRGLDVARRSASVRHLVSMRSDITEPLIRSGRVADALAQAEEAVEAAEAYPHASYRWYPRWTYGSALLRADRFREARVQLDEAEKIEHAATQPLTPVIMAYTGAGILLGTGQLEAALAALTEVRRLGGMELTALPVSVRQPAWEILVRSALEQGERAEAEALVAEASAATEEAGLAAPQGDAAGLRALLAAAGGDAGAAADEARAAVRFYEEGGARLKAERARIVLASHLAELGHKSDAVAELAKAEETLAELGADVPRAEAVREMRRLGRRAPVRGNREAAPEAEGELAALSAREREVAELVAEQLTNREIGERLFLSEKTVESHLRNTFAKLGVSSRIAVAQAVERQRLS